MISNALVEGVLLTIGDTAALLTIPGSVLLALAAARKFVRFLNRLEEALKPDALGKTVAQQVAEIQKQLVPNGGTSLRDAVNSVKALAVTAADHAVDAKAAAEEAAMRAQKAEMLGKFELRDIRRRLENIDGKMDSASTILSAHLIDAAQKTAEINGRLEQIERRSA